MHTFLILNIQVHNHDFILGNYNIILGLHNINQGATDHTTPWNWFNPRGWQINVLISNEYLYAGMFTLEAVQK